ncbi:hypothetical protein BDZ45DRAFT_691426 [Acephala macrosclerotiorum]|nr:hypothetical protein BDZ45DRAFT_691426 [Acephala macrosclerotiorum]
MTSSANGSVLPGLMGSRDDWRRYTDALTNSVTQSSTSRVQAEQSQPVEQVNQSEQVCQPDQLQRVKETPSETSNKHIPGVCPPECLQFAECSNWRFFKTIKPVTRRKAQGSFVVLRRVSEGNEIDGSEVISREETAEEAIKNDYGYARRILQHWRTRIIESMPEELEQAGEFVPLCYYCREIDCWAACFTGNPFYKVQLTLRHLKSKIPAESYWSNLGVCTLFSVWTLRMYNSYGSRETCKPDMEKLSGLLVDDIKNVADGRDGKLHQILCLESLDSIGPQELYVAQLAIGLGAAERDFYWFVVGEEEWYMEPPVTFQPLAKDSWDHTWNESLLTSDKTWEATQLAKIWSPKLKGGANNKPSEKEPTEEVPTRKQIASMERRYLDGKRRNNHLGAGRLTSQPRPKTPPPGINMFWPEDSPVDEENEDEPLRKKLKIIRGATGKPPVRGAAAARESLLQGFEGDIDGWLAPDEHSAAQGLSQGIEDIDDAVPTTPRPQRTRKPSRRAATSVQSTSAAAVRQVAGSSRSENTTTSRSNRSAPAQARLRTSVPAQLTPSHPPQSTSGAVPQLVAGPSRSANATASRSNRAGPSQARPRTSPLAQSTPNQPQPPVACRPDCVRFDPYVHNPKLTPGWGITYEPGHLSDLGLVPGHFHDAGGKVLTKHPSAMEMYRTVLRRFPGGQAKTTVLRGMVDEWRTQPFKDDTCKQTMSRNKLKVRKDGSVTGIFALRDMGTEDGWWWIHEDAPELNGQEESEDGEEDTADADLPMKVEEGLDLDEEAGTAFGSLLGIEEDIDTSRQAALDADVSMDEEGLDPGEEAVLASPNEPMELEEEPEHRGPTLRVFMPSSERSSPPNVDRAPSLDVSRQNSGSNEYSQRSEDVSNHLEQKSQRKTSSPDSSDTSQDHSNGNSRSSPGIGSSPPTSLGSLDSSLDESKPLETPFAERNSPPEAMGIP